jgi:hypothetical protein
MRECALANGRSLRRISECLQRIENRPSAGRHLLPANAAPAGDCVACKNNFTHNAKENSNEIK